MAEFCLECWNKIMDTNDPKEKFILSRRPDFCEECRQWKPVIIRVKNAIAFCNGCCANKRCSVRTPLIIYRL